MTIKKQHGKPTTATERMQAARSSTQSAMIQVVCLASILSRFAKAWLADPLVPNEDFPAVMVIDTPAGWLTQRIHRDELPLVAHLERKTDRMAPQSLSDKLALLTLLATEGWS